MQEGRLLIQSVKIQLAGSPIVCALQTTSFISHAILREEEVVFPLSSPIAFRILIITHFERTRCDRVNEINQIQSDAAGQPFDSRDKPIHSFRLRTLYRYLHRQQVCQVRYLKLEDCVVQIGDSLMLDGIRSRRLSKNEVGMSSSSLHMYLIGGRFDGNFGEN